MDIPCVTPGGAFYAFPNISCLGSSDDIWRLFIDKAHVSTTPGNMFGAQGEDYLRLSYANSLSNIEKALDRIEKVVRRKT
jgi:aspartate aminotransferase